MYRLLHEPATTLKPLNSDLLLKVELANRGDFVERLILTQCKLVLGRSVQCFPLSSDHIRNGVVISISYQRSELFWFMVHLSADLNKVQ